MSLHQPGAERVVRGDEEPALAALRHDRFADRVRDRVYVLKV